jgi:hypothetical protein
LNFKFLIKYFRRRKEMKLAKTAFITTLLMLTLIVTASAQTLRSNDDPRNIAPTVGTGGPPGGPTGLFTIYDGQTLRKGEFTFSAAYSNFDRDPGDVDIVEVPLSFQIGLSDHVELFFTTDGYRAIKVNSTRNLSGFYLPNSSYGYGAIVLAPRGPGTSQYPGAAIYRPPGTAPFVAFPYGGGNAGTFGIVGPTNPGTVFGFTGGFALLGPGSGGNGNSAGNFPGIGSVFGGILPGVVLQTRTLPGGGTVPTSFTLQPTYLPDAPLLNRGFGESAFSTFTVGGKWRWTGPSNPVGVGIIPFYRFYADSADTASGFNQLQRGASAGGNRGDFGVIAFADARLRKWLNISANIGYVYNSSIKSNGLTLLDRPDEVLAGVGLDFPVNNFFQPILEFRSTYYVGGRTPNAFENSPIEGLAGARVYPTRWMSLGGAYRYHFNSQDRGFFDGNTSSSSVAVAGINTPFQSSFTGTPPGFRTSTDAHGFLLQVSAGRRNERTDGKVKNEFANVTDVRLSDTVVRTPCGPGMAPKEGTACSDSQAVNVSTTAEDKENDVLTYNYTVTGGKVNGQGANVSWDLSGVNPGTYTITAGVDDGCGICGKTQTKTITVEACECVSVCVCPSGVSVAGPSDLVIAGESITFVANVSGGSGNNTYNWSVSNGSITNGQGTSSITVATTSDMAGSNVTATVETMDTDCKCGTQTGSETAVIQGIEEKRQVDTFGKLNNDDIRGRLDNYFVTLQNDPNASGYIINYGPPKEVAAREKLMKNHIKFRNFDPSRITFVNGGNKGEGLQTTLWVVPAGATAPAP